MKNLSDINNIKEILRKYGFKFSKSLGQNFLINSSVCPQMAQATLQYEDQCVLEIGPGIGVLTCELAKRASKVVSIELDNKLIPILKDTLSEFDNVKIINGDFLKLDIKKILQEEFPGKKVSICANLPYYITSEVIMKILEEELDVKNVVVMIQKEAANRICALPGNRDVGAISFAVRYYSEPEMLFGVDRESFVPAPNVDSAVIKLNIINQPPVNIKDEKTFFTVIKKAFAQRRKTLLNSLSSGFSLSKDQIKLILEKSNVGFQARAEEISMDKFADISNQIFDLR